MDTSPLRSRAALLSLGVSAQGFLCLPETTRAEWDVLRFPVTSDSPYLPEGIREGRRADLLIIDDPTPPPAPSSRCESDELQAYVYRWQHNSKKQRQADRIADQVIALLETRIKRIAGQYDWPGIEQQELHQEGRLAVLQALKRYKFGKGATFATFVKLTILGSILNYGNANAIPDPERLADLIVENLGVEDWQEDTERQIVIAAAIDSLPERLADVILRRYVDGYTYAEIGAALGISGRYVGKLEEQALILLRDSLGQEVTNIL